MESKKYLYEYEDYEDGEKDAKTMAKEIADDLELPKLEEIIVGCWGEAYENDVQSILDVFVEQKEKFLHVKSLFIGDMDYEECEVSWIKQGDYSRLWNALPNLEQLTIKGSSELVLGDICHENLKSLEIICGGLPKSVIRTIAEAHLPKLEKLNLYIGIEDYGFDGEGKDLEALLTHVKTFEKLNYLGLGDSEIQDEIAELVMRSGLAERLEVLDLSNGTLSDKGGQILLAHREDLAHLKKLDLHHHFMSEKVMKQFSSLGIEVDLSEKNENDDKYGNYPMLTE